MTNFTDRAPKEVPKGRAKDVCIEVPPQVNSNGFWVDPSVENPHGLLRNSLPELELQMFVIIFISQTFHFVFKRFGLSRISSEMITGLFLAYVLADEHGNPRNEKLLSPAGQSVLGTISLLGYALFLFVTAVKMNSAMVLQTGAKAATLGVVALMVPFSIGMFTQKAVGNFHSLESIHQLDTLPTVFITHSLVSFPVIYTLLSELNLVNSEIGRLALASAMVADLLSYFLGNFYVLIRVFEGSAQRGIRDLIGRFSFLLLVVFVFRPIMMLIVKRTPEGRPVKGVYVYGIILLAFGTALSSNFLDEQIFMGPYLLGMAVPEGPPLGTAIVDKLDCFVMGLFLPLYVTSSALRVDFTQNRFNPLVKADITMMVIVQISKMVACITTTMLYHMPRHDSLVLALILSCKGIVDIGLFTYWRDEKFIDQTTFNAVIYGILVISIFVSVSVKFLHDPARKYAGYQKRNIMHMKPRAELRVLTCIHKHEDIAAMIDLLDAACPTAENPIGVYVLHLIELVGRATPVFISHQVQKTTLSHVSYSQNVILSFNRFANNNWGSVKVHAFTAVSPYKLMHEDICTLALDKLVSLAVLPFHRKWAMDGSVESDDSTMRALNLAVLERSPCSVGILINRGFAGGKGPNNGSASVSSQEPYIYSICVVFLGGPDDREAMALARRMGSKSQSAGMSIRVVRLVGPDEAVLPAKEETGKWDTVVDAEALKDLKERGGGGSVRCRVGYTEEVVVDGSETAPLVRAMADDYDLVIVGRSHPPSCRQLSGLDLAWAEFPELGVIGDLLASKDIYGKASVLVVKQQDTD